MVLSWSSHYRTACARRLAFCARMSAFSRTKGRRPARIECCAAATLPYVWFRSCLVRCDRVSFASRPASIIIYVSSRLVRLAAQLYTSTPWLSGSLASRLHSWITAAQLACSDPTRSLLQPSRIVDASCLAYFVSRSDWGCLVSGPACTQSHGRPLAKL